MPNKSFGSETNKYLHQLPQRKNTGNERKEKTTTNDKYFSICIELKYNSTYIHHLQYKKPNLWPEDLNRKTTENNKANETFSKFFTLNLVFSLSLSLFRFGVSMPIWNKYIFVIAFRQIEYIFQTKDTNRHRCFFISILLLSCYILFSQFLICIFTLILMCCSFLILFSRFPWNIHQFQLFNAMPWWCFRRI